MEFDKWWETLTTKEQFLLGKHNARFVWNQACESCADLIFKMIQDEDQDNHPAWVALHKAQNAIRKEKDGGLP